MQIVNEKQGLKPILAIVLYSDGNNDYAESMELENGLVKNVIPLEKETMGLFNDMNNGGFYCNGIIPRHILNYSKNTLIWAVKAQQRTIDREGTEIEIDCPKMIFKWEDGSLYVFCNRGQKLYYAPFWNVSNNGAVCLGSAKPKDIKEVVEMADHLEDIFFTSTFTHANSKVYDLETFWDKKAKKQKLKFYKDLNEIL